MDCEGFGSMVVALMFMSVVEVGACTASSAVVDSHAGILVDTSHFTRRASRHGNTPYVCGTVDLLCLETPPSLAVHFDD